MKDPYDVLDLPPSADEAAVRRRYLELVRSFSPERSPERFAEIRAAYEQLRDPVRLLEQQLFEISTGDTLEDIIADVRTQLRSRRIPTDTLLSLVETTT
jgi:curved DNA-binding protein CbpA